MPSVWSVVLRHPERDRGYDDTNGWGHPETWERAIGQPTEVVCAILRAVADVAGFYASADCAGRPDLTSDNDRAVLERLIGEFDAATAALRDALNNRSPSE